MAETFTPRGYHPARLFDPRGGCTGCLLCAVICPDVAITVYRSIPEKPEAQHNQLPVRNQPLMSQNQAPEGTREANVQPPRQTNERALER
jgi:ferredoxin